MSAINELSKFVVAQVANDPSLEGMVIGRRTQPFMEQFSDDVEFTARLDSATNTIPSSKGNDDRRGRMALHQALSLAGKKLKNERIPNAGVSLQ